VDVLVVDGNSSMARGKSPTNWRRNTRKFTSCIEQKKNGLGRAYIAGFKWALEHGYEFIFEMDCDFSHNPDDIPMFLEAAKNQDADLVLGSRYSGGVRVVNWPLKRLMLSRCAGIYVWLVTGMPFTDPTGGYKCFRRRALQAINLDRSTRTATAFKLK
jgi:dolichol-phosphate mannosyltransferase